MNLKESYLKETGEEAICKDSEGAYCNTAAYVEWLEENLKHTVTELDKIVNSITNRTT